MGRNVALFFTSLNNDKFAFSIIGLGLVVTWGNCQLLSVELLITYIIYKV